MAKNNTAQVDEVEEIDETEEAPKGIRPKELAAELGIDPKTLRGRLRRMFPRTAEEKNTSWTITEEMREAVLAAVAKEAEADEDDDSDEEDED